MNESSRDDESSPQRGLSPSTDLQQRAFEALKGHPHYLAAASNGYCVPTAKLIPTSSIERFRFDEETKATLKERLKDSDTVLLISYFTAPTNQEAISGSGEIFDFALHPKTMEVLHTSSSFWIA